jgi:hypothetical protein
LEAKWDHPLSIRRGRNRINSLDQQILL